MVSSLTAYDVFVTSKPSVPPTRHKFPTLSDAQDFFNASKKRDDNWKLELVARSTTPDDCSTRTIATHLQQPRHWCNYV